MEQILKRSMHFISYRYLIEQSGYELKIRVTTGNLDSDKRTLNLIPSPANYQISPFLPAALFFQVSFFPRSPFSLSLSLAEPTPKSKSTMWPPTQAQVRGPGGGAGGCDGGANDPSSFFALPLIPQACFLFKC